MNKSKLTIGIAACAALVAMNFIYAANGYGSESSYVKSVLASLGAGSGETTGGTTGGSTGDTGDKSQKPEDLPKLECGNEYTFYYKWVKDDDGNRKPVHVGTLRFCNGDLIEQYNGTSDYTETKKDIKKYYGGNKCVSTINIKSTCTPHVYDCTQYVKCKKQ